MTAYEFIKSLPFRPYTGLHGRASNSELFRWLNNKSITINTVNPQAHNEVILPIEKLVFFKGDKQITYQ